MGNDQLHSPVARLEIHHASRISLGLQLRLEFVALFDDQALGPFGFNDLAGIGEAAIRKLGRP
jgi:hypothetical protein